VLGPREALGNHLQQHLEVLEHREDRGGALVKREGLGEVGDIAV